MAFKDFGKIHVQMRTICLTGLRTLCLGCETTRREGPRTCFPIMAPVSQGLNPVKWVQSSYFDTLKGSQWLRFEPSASKNEIGKSPMSWLCNPGSGGPCIDHSGRCRALCARFGVSENSAHVQKRVSEACFCVALPVRDVGCAVQGAVGLNCGVWVQQSKGWGRATWTCWWAPRGGAFALAQPRPWHLVMGTSAHGWGAGGIILRHKSLFLKNECFWRCF